MNKWEISKYFTPHLWHKSIHLFKYVKSKDEDFNSILTGIMQFKGNIHIEFNKPITVEEISQAAVLDKNERFKFLMSAMDKRIISSFKLWKNN